MDPNSESIDENAWKLDQLAAAGDSAGVARVVRQLEGTELQGSMIIASARFWLEPTEPA